MFLQIACCGSIGMIGRMTRERPVRSVVFDLDGTLVDSISDITAALDEALASRGHFGVTRDVVVNFVGDGARRLVERAVAHVGAPPEEADPVEVLYLDLYRRNHLERTCLYPGVAETLEQFSARGVQMAVVSNKPAEFTVSLLEHLGVASHFRVVLGADSLPERKPSPMPVLTAVAACDVKPEEAAMVGDGEPDMRAGRAAGVYTVGVLYGFRDAATLTAAGADALVERASDLFGVLIGGGAGR